MTTNIAATTHGKGENTKMRHLGIAMLLLVGLMFGCTAPTGETGTAGTPISQSTPTPAALSATEAELVAQNHVGASYACTARERGTYFKSTNPGWFVRCSLRPIMSNIPGYIPVTHDPEPYFIDDRRDIWAAK